jgi:hypothetical protein
MTYAVRLSRRLGSLAALGMLVGSASMLRAQMPRAKTPDDPMATIPKLSTLVGQPGSELADVVERYAADQSSLTRRYDANDSQEQRKRMREFFTGWRTRLGEINFDKLSQEGRVDYVLLDNHIQYQLALLDRQDKNRSETVVLLPFAERLLALQDTRRTLAPVDPRASAKIVAAVAKTRLDAAVPVRPRLQCRATPDARARPHRAYRRP